MADPISGRKVFIKINAKGQEDQIKQLFYENHFPYEVNTKGEIYIRSNQFEKLLQLLVGIEYELSSKHLEKRKESFKIPEPLPLKESKEPTAYKLEPYRSQLRSLQDSLGKRTSLIGDKMGEGKTFTGIMFAEELKSVYQFKHALILNGVSSNQYNWVKEVEKFSREDAYIIGQREIKTGPRKGQIRIGSNADKLKDLEKGIEEFYLVANIHMLRDRKILDKLKEMVYDGTVGVVIVDEIHKCVGITSPKDLDKNKKTKVQALQELRPYFRVGMSGTPFNEPTDMYDIEAWLGRAYATKTQYQERYGMMVLDNSKMWLRKKHAGFLPQKYIMTEYDLFKKEIQRYLVRSGAKRDLPPITFENYYVELHPEQYKALDSLGDEISIHNLANLSLDQMREEIRKPQHMTKRKIVSLPYLEGVEKDAKLDSLVEILEEIEKNGDSAVVFTYFSEAPTYYRGKLGVKGIFVEQSDDSNTVFEKANRFQEGEGTVLVGGYGKIGTGLNIERADYAIYVDTPITWNDYEQSLFRLLRGSRGDRPVHVVKLVAVGTYDEVIQDNVGERKLQHDAVLGQSMSDEAVEE